MRDAKEYAKGKTWENWMNNPACVFAGMVQSLVLDYRVYSGDTTYTAIVREMLDHQLQYGTTPANWPWANVPYASADPGVTTYKGATKWENEGMRGDGLYGIEPDKVGELGYAYLKFYEVTEEVKYLQAALNCADALAKNRIEMTIDGSNFASIKSFSSPWPFRVNAKSGLIIDKYTSHVIDAVRLFDELVRIKERLKLSEQRIKAYQNASSEVWKWLYSKGGPMKTYAWNNYFEDIPNDSTITNRTQLTPMETARYIIKNPSLDKDFANTIPALLYYVKSAFGTEGLDAIKEQTWCYEPMGSHTARYASICALWYEKTGDVKYKEEAYRHFNFATYMTDANGVVRVGPTWPGSWFSDGYSDYIKHFMEGLGAIPEWAPAGENHVLRASSAVQKINYSANKVRFTTFDNGGNEVLRVATKPKSVLLNGKKMAESTNLVAEGWTWKPLEKGGIVRINHQTGRQIIVEL